MVLNSVQTFAERTSSHLTTNSSSLTSSMVGKKCFLISSMISLALVIPLAMMSFITFMTSANFTWNFAAISRILLHTSAERASSHLKLVAMSMIFLADQFDDFLSFGDSLSNGFTDNFVNHFNLDLQFLGSFFQGGTDFLREDIFACDGIFDHECCRWEKVLLDFLDDFLGLGDSLGDDFFHHFHDGFVFDLHGSSNFLDLGAPAFGEDIFAFEIGGEFDNFFTDQLDDFVSLGDSLFDGFTDDFVNNFSFYFQFLGSFVQGFADFLSKDFFTGDGILVNVEFSRWEKVLLDFLNDFLGLGDSLGNDLFHHFHDGFEFDLHGSSNFLDLVAPFSLEYIFAFQVGGHVNDFLADQFDDFLSFGDSLSNGFTDNFVNHFNFDLQFLGSFF